MNLFVARIADKIQSARSAGKKGIYLINERVSDSDVEALKEYYKDSPEYHLNLHKCARCKRSWDIIITF